MKSILWRVAKRLSYIEDTRCLEVHEGAEVQILSFLTSAIKASEKSNSSPGSFTPGTDCIGRWWSKHTVLKFCGEETITAPARIQILQCPDRNKWIHRLR